MRPDEVIKTMSGKEKASFSLTMALLLLQILWAYMSWSLPREIAKVDGLTVAQIKHSEVISNLQEKVSNLKETDSHFRDDLKGMNLKLDKVLSSQAQIIQLFQRRER